MHNKQQNAEEICVIDTVVLHYWKQLCRNWNYQQAYDRILKVAENDADLSASENISRSIWRKRYNIGVLDREGWGGEESNSKGWSFLILEWCVETAPHGRTYRRGWLDQAIAEYIQQDYKNVLSVFIPFNQFMTIESIGER